MTLVFSGEGASVQIIMFWKNVYWIYWIQHGFILRKSQVIFDFVIFDVLFVDARLILEAGYGRSQGLPLDE